MIYYFEIENGRLEDGLALVVIQNHTAVISADDGPALALAQRNGGILQIVNKKSTLATQPLKEIK